jgi:hypothetical protein
MDNEVKWICIMCAVVLAVPMIGITLDHYSVTHCKVVAIQQHMDADDIIKLCGKQ